MSLNLESIRNRLKSLQNTTTKRGYLWKPEPGKTTIRIVPYAFNKENPFIELYFHYNIGKKSYLSLETFGESDPIVEFSEKLKQTGSKEDWTLGKKLEPTLRTFVPIIVRGKEKEGVKFWGFGKTIYQELLSIIADPDYGDITDPLKGHDITIDYQTPAEAGNSFGKATIRVRPQETKVTDDKEVADMIVNQQVDIYEIYKKSTYEELEEALKNWLNPNDEEEGETETKSQTSTKSEESKPVSQTKSNKVDDVSKAFDDLFKS